MSNTNAKHITWSYGPEYQGTRDLIDPRIPLARQIAWIKSNTEYTDYKTPEPDNFNRAILAHIPMECKFIEDQVFYKYKDFWISLLYVPEEQIIDCDVWIRECRPLAVWCHIKPPRVKQQRQYLWTRENISDETQTDNERLYTMGYYENLKSKYFSDDTTYVDSLLGVARAILDNPQQEDEDDKVEDY